MTLNGHFALKSVSDSATIMGWRLRLSDKTVRKLAKLPIYCQRQKCSPENVVSGGIRFMQIFAGVRWRGGFKWESGRRKWRFSVHSVTVFRTFYIHGHTTAFRWYDCQWPWGNFGETRGGVGKSGVLEHKSGNISETRKLKIEEVTMEGLRTHQRFFGRYHCRPHTHPLLPDWRCETPAQNSNRKLRETSAHI